MFAALDFEFQHAVKNWLAVRGRIKIDARLGTDVQSLISAGVNATVGYEFGWLIKVVSKERYMLSANVDISNRTITAIILSDMIQDIIDGVPPHLVQNIPALRGHAGLRFAYGVSPLLGITAIAVGGYGESVDRRARNQFSFRGGLSVDFDLRPGTGVPLGFLLGYTFESFPEQGNDFIGATSKAAFRIEYTGRSDLGLGLGFSAEGVETEAFRRTLLYSVRIDLRYFF